MEGDKLVKELTVINKNGKFVADSREVAEMVEKRHDNLLRDIDDYVQIMETSILRDASGLQISDFFMPNEYQIGNRKYRCYDITKKGCEMVANKLTGEKGVLFTAAYVTKFNDMEQTLHQPLKVDVSLHIAESAFRELRLPDSGKLAIYSKICKEYNVSDKILPDYADEEVTKSLSDLLKQFNVGMSATKVNQILLDKGILEQKTRKAKSSIKIFWSLTESGLKYGKNLISPANPRETQPHYYEKKFEDLIAVLGGSNLDPTGTER